MSLVSVELLLIGFAAACLLGLAGAALLAMPRAVRESNARLADSAAVAPPRSVTPAAPAPDLRAGLRKSRSALVGRLERLLSGLIDTADLAYFALVTAAFLLLTRTAVESARWR